MKLMDFKIRLEYYKIYLSDAQLRIAHFRFNTLSNDLNYDLFDKLCDKNKCLVDIFVNSLVNNDTNKINYIINSLI